MFSNGSPNKRDYFVIKLDGDRASSIIGTDDKIEWKLFAICKGYEWALLSFSFKFV